MKRLKITLFSVALSSILVAGTATWDGFAGQMAAHDATVAANCVVASALVTDEVHGVMPGKGQGTTALSIANPVDTRFKMMAESAETRLVARPFALVITFR